MDDKGRRELPAGAVGWSGLRGKVSSVGEGRGDSAGAGKPAPTAPTVEERGPTRSPRVAAPADHRRLRCRLAAPGAGRRQAGSAAVAQRDKGSPTRPTPRSAAGPRRRRRRRRGRDQQGGATPRRPGGQRVGAPPPRSGRSFGVEEMKKFDAVSDDRRDLPNRGDGTNPRR